MHRDQLAEINAAAALPKAAASGAAPFAEPVATAASLSGADTVNELKATLEKQTVKQLKLELEKAGLDLKGKKSILVDRLAEHQLGAIAPEQRAAAEKAQIGTMELDGPSATVAAESAVRVIHSRPRRKLRGGARRRGARPATGCARARTARRRYVGADHHGYRRGAKRRRDGGSRYSGGGGG